MGSERRWPQPAAPYGTTPGPRAPTPERRTAFDQGARRGARRHGDQVALPGQRQP
jgi:hypothetical protein